MGAIADTATIICRSPPVALVNALRTTSWGAMPFDVLADLFDMRALIELLCTDNAQYCAWDFLNESCARLGRSSRLCSLPGSTFSDTIARRGLGRLTSS